MNGLGSGQCADADVHPCTFECEVSWAPSSLAFERAFYPMTVLLTSSYKILSGYVNGNTFRTTHRALKFYLQENLPVFRCSSLHCSIHDTKSDTQWYFPAEYIQNRDRRTQQQSNTGIFPSFLNKPSLLYNSPSIINFDINLHLYRHLFSDFGL